MNKYGLTDDEKRTHLQEYNHALFKNSMSFMDMVWEINVKHGTIVILEDKGDPGNNLIEREYESFIKDYELSRVSPDDIEAFRSHMSYDVLKNLKDEVSFSVHLRTADDEKHLHRIVLTPAADENDETFCVYLGAINMHEEENREMLEYRTQEQFKDALLSGSYFHFDFDVTAGGLITEEFMAADGTYPIKDATRMSAPVPFEVWIDKWYELYEPEFDEQEVGNIFSIEYFKQAFSKNERLLSVEVKQKPQHGNKESEYMHIFVILYENPADKHIRACIVWKEITPFRREVLEDKLELEARNEELKRTVSREEQFRQTSLFGAILVFNINLTKNLIEDEFYEIIEGKTFPMLELVGLEAPCSFSEFCKRWADEKVLPSSKESFIEMFNKDYLIDAYERGERQLEMEFDTVIGRGIPLTVRNTALLVKDEETGDIIAMINGRDITKQKEDDRKKQEALQSAYETANRANAAKSEFLFKMSHDIRTPMNAIIGMTAIAAANLDDRAHVLNSLQKINLSSKHLLGLINEVLDMSKIESGKVELQNEPFNISVLFDSAAEIVKPDAAAKKHGFVVFKENIKHENVIGDSQLINQALINLLGNAIKYTPEGGTVKFSLIEKPNGQINVGRYEFVIEDNGIGMSEEFKEHLFEPFVRSDDERVADEQGTGLGMAITKSIAQLMDGVIEVESELNKGSRFAITFFLKLQDKELRDAYLPELISADVEGDALKTTINQYKGEDLSKARILLVEDNDINAEIAIEIIEMTGACVDHVWNGREAVDILEKCEDGYYDLVFMDIQMPVLNGYEATQEIRSSIRSYLKSVPIIAMSANAFSEDVKKSIESGMNEHVSKPLDFDYLLKVLEKWLKKEN